MAKSFDVRQAILASARVPPWACVAMLLACLALSGCAHKGAQITDRDRADAIGKLADSVVSQRGVPGIAIAVTRDGRLFKKLALGYADLGTHTKVTGATPFQLASTTKIFSSTAVLLLVAKGKVHLDDPIGTYLNALPEDWKTVTVRQLLTDTSGLPDITRETGQIDLVADDWEHALPIVSKQPFQFRPGSGWAYTQTNYAILQRLVARVSAMSFEDFLEARLFRPLGMHKTFFPGPGRRCATNYQRTRDGTIVGRPGLSFPRYVHAAGGLCSSMDDQLVWSAALESGKVIPLTLLAQARAPARLSDGSTVKIGRSLSYGMGRAIGTVPGARWVGHSGGNSTAVRRYPDQHMTIIVLHNGTSDPDAIADSVARIMLEKTAAGSAQADLWDAAALGNRAAVETAIQAGADVNALDTRSSRNGRYALNWAAINNHPDIIKLLLAHGARIDAQNLSGFTALHHAAESGSVDAARALLAAGANTSLRNANGETAADVARRDGNTAVATLIDGTSGTKGSRGN